MSFWSKIDNYFAPKPSGKYGSTAAAAAAAAILLYVKNLISRPQMAEELLARVEKFIRKKSSSDYEGALSLYVEMEKFLILNEPVKNYTKEILREDVRVHFDIKSTNNVLEAFFFPGHEPFVRLYGVYVSQLADELIEIEGESGLQHTIEAATKGTILNNLRVKNGKLDFTLVYQALEDSLSRRFEVIEQVAVFAEKFTEIAKQILGDNKIGFLYTKLESIKKNIEFLIDLQNKYEDVVPIAISSRTRAMIQHVGMGQLIEDGEISSFETALVTKKGENRQMSISASTLKSIDGDFNGFVISAKDLSGIRKLEKEKIEILENAKELAEAEVETTTKKLEKTNMEIIATQSKLEDQVFELERFTKVAVGRELKMIELKKEINNLRQQHNEH